MNVGEQQRQLTKVCMQCGESCKKSDFANRQWKREQSVCKSCTEMATATATTKLKKICAQCRKKCDEEQFPKKQWKKEEPLCRLCFELTKASAENSRVCHHCKIDQPRNQYDYHQWGTRGEKALCFECKARYEEKMLSNIGKNTTKDLPDGTTVCAAHSSDVCDICMMDFRLQNRMAIKQAAIGRLLTDEECDEEFKALFGGINTKVCIMDGHPVCPRTSRKLRCPCNEVTYCSKQCQVHHFTIHKMTCKDYARKKEAKKEKKAKQAKAQTKASAPTTGDQPPHGLTEEQLTNIRIEAFFAENNGGEHSIEECAWQLGEHPFVIGGGSIKYTRNGEEIFEKGDVAKIYREKCGAIWDGSPRFGMGPYVQKKPYFDWIAKAREGKSQKEIELKKELERFMRG